MNVNQGTLDEEGVKEICYVLLKAVLNAIPREVLMKAICDLSLQNTLHTTYFETRCFFCSPFCALQFFYSVSLSRES